MTREEAIEKLHWFALDNRDKQIIDTAIEALTSQNLTEPNKTCEADLISRNDAMGAVQAEIRCTDRAEDVSGLTLAKFLIDQAPTVSADVVRCKDCIQKHIGGSVTHYYWCDRWDMEVDDTDYCSWGERND